MNILWGRRSDFYGSILDRTSSPLYAHIEKTTQRYLKCLDKLMIMVHGIIFYHHSSDQIDFLEQKSKVILTLWFLCQSPVVY